MVRTRSGSVATMTDKEPKEITNLRGKGKKDNVTLADNAAAVIAVYENTNRQANVLDRIEKFLTTITGETGGNE